MWSGSKNSGVQTAQKAVEIPAVDVPVLFSDKFQQSRVYVLKVPQVQFVDDFGHSCCAAETGTHSANFKVQVLFLGKVVVPVVLQRQLRGVMC